MGEIRNARCLFLQSWWLQYADHPVDPICRSWPGSITPIMRWILYADHQVAPLGRSLTRGGSSPRSDPPSPARTTRMSRQLQCRTRISAGSALADPMHHRCCTPVTRCGVGRDRLVAEQKVSRRYQPHHLHDHVPRGIDRRRPLLDSGRYFGRYEGGHSEYVAGGEPGN